MRLAHCFRFGSANLASDANDHCVRTSAVELTCALDLCANYGARSEAEKLRTQTGVLKGFCGPEVSLAPARSFVSLRVRKRLTSVEACERVRKRNRPSALVRVRFRCRRRRRRYSQSRYSQSRYSQSRPKLMKGTEGKDASACVRAHLKCVHATRHCSRQVCAG